MGAAVGVTVVGLGELAILLLLLRLLLLRVLHSTTVLRRRSSPVDSGGVWWVTRLSTMGSLRSEDCWRRGLVSGRSLAERTLAAGIANRAALQHRAATRHVAGVRRSQRDLPLSVISRRSLTASRSTAPVIVARDLGLDTASVWRGSNQRQDGTDRFHQAELHVNGGVVQGCLDYIVGEGIAQQSLNLLGSQHFLDNQVPGRGRGASQALLYNVGAELVARELAHATLKHGNDGLGKASLVEIDDVLNNVVSKWILHENSGVLSDARNEPVLLIARSVVDAALQDAASVAVSADFDAVVTDSVKDELGIQRCELVQALLDDVVAIQILDKLDNTETQGLDDEMNLLRRADILNHLLQGACSMLVKGNADHVLGCILYQDGTLIVIAELKQLLAQIITKRVCHELDDVHIGLSPNQVNLLRRALLQLLLQVAAPVLVLAQVVDLTLESLDWCVGVAGHGYQNGDVSGQSINRLQVCLGL